ncbi:MAG: multidrug efflux RND transporter permease subunit [Deltaproteobacteria bacterium]|jgi:hydrophobe/amphiphile efflux-1 (HAE1) family protein|nr:multidrug efflux RND transporter permease subunit [Deltaproteobacteria bacterium]
MFSKFFIQRPIFSSVLSLMIVMAGLISVINLPVEQYPELTPPTIVVSAQYPGASSEIIAETVAGPLERQINGVDDALYLYSTASSNGDLAIQVFFKVGTDPDQAMINVNNRVQVALNSLPEEVRRYGVTVNKRSSTMLKLVSLYSPNNTLDATFLGNYASVYLLDELKRVAGVGDVSILGVSEYSMRVWIKPDRIANLGLSITEVVAVIREQNSQRAAGMIGSPPMPKEVPLAFSIIAEGRFKTVEEFENIIIKAYPDGATLRLKDVADVELGALSYAVKGRNVGRASIAISFYLSPGANALETSARIDKKIAELASSFPNDMDYSVPFDTTKFIQASIEEVVDTLRDAIFLVCLVVFLFLKDWRATLIPCLAVPVSIIGAFAGMMAFGFSINTLTLFGLVLAVGIVVDDAIIVIENTERLMREEKLSVRDATIKAMQEVTEPVIAIVLVLCAVFVPVSFMSGMAGVMYKQFAVTIVVSVVISGFVALTLTPALCVLLLREHHAISARSGWWERFTNKFDSSFENLTGKYTGMVNFLVRRLPFVIIVTLFIWLISGVMFVKTPTSLVPDEDQGVFITALIMDPGAALTRTEETLNAVENFILQQKEVYQTAGVTGFDLLSTSVKNDSGVLFASLKPWSERKKESESVQSLVRKVLQFGQSIQAGIVLSFSPPPIVGMSLTGGFEGYLQSKTGVSSEELANKASELVAKASARKELTNVKTTFNARTPQYEMQVDKIKTRSLGVSITDVYTAMQATFGTVYVNDFTLFGRSLKVMLQAQSEYRDYAEKIDRVFVKSTTTGGMIPLSSLITLTPKSGTANVDHFNIFKSAKILADPAPGYSTGEGIMAFEEVANEVLDGDYGFSWTGSAYQQKESGSASTLALALGVLVVFLILAAQYERWSLPFAVILAVPFALFGALIAVNIFGLTNDMYFQIALITLIGLSAKNAILIVEFAVASRAGGMSAIEAAIQAARLRFRPIIMTSLVFIAGNLPLVLSSGAGANSRISLGMAVIGGMLAATLITPLLVPAFYVLITGKK